MNITLNKKPGAKTRTPFGSSTSLDGRIGFYAAVTELHPENNTVHLVTDTGIELMNIKVASPEWVTYNKDNKPALTGKRHLPPVGTYVFCLSPTGRYEESFVLCSLFSDSSIHADYMEEGDDAANIEQTVENGGWVKTTDYRNGTKTFRNKMEDETIKIEIDQKDEGDEKATVTIHGNVFTVTKDGFEFTTDGTKTVSVEKDSETTIKGNVADSIDGDYSFEAGGNIKMKSNKTGTLEIGNSVDTLGKVVSDLMQQLISLKTVGSPATQTASPDFISQVTALKTKWEQIFK